MFGKSREEDYDRYNEEVNSKYDDDYISDNREYREECSHEHGITYDNYDEAPERTYEDAETSIGFTLQSGERLIWSGSADKRSKLRERGGCGCIFIFPILWLMPSLSILAASAAISPAMAIMPGIFVLIGLAILAVMIRFSKADGQYAVTDRRVISRRGGILREMSLGKISTANGVDLGRGIGWVKFVPRKFSGQSQSYIEVSGFYGVNEPKEISNIVNKAIRDYHRNKSKISR